MKISNLLDRDFKVVTVKLFEEFWRRLDKKGEKLEIYNKELENIKNQTDLENTKSEIKNTLEGINSKFDYRGMDN